MRLKTIIVLILVATMFLLTACGDDILDCILEGEEIMTSDVLGDDRSLQAACITRKNELPYQGTFLGSVGWSLEHDTWFLAIEFTITPEAALEIGSAILRHTFGEEALNGNASVFKGATEDNVFVITYMSASESEFRVTLAREDARILQVYHNGKTDFIITQELALEIGDAALRLALGERVFMNAVFRVAEVTRDNAFAVWRIPIASLNATGEFPLAIISSIDGRIMQIGHG